MFGAKPFATTFGKLQPGDRFEYEGEVWRKLDDNPEASGKVMALQLDNAVMLRLRTTRRFSGGDFVTPLRPPRLSFWRKWLLSRSLRWQVAGFTSWAKWTWRLARVLASEKTDQAMAAHVATLLMMGE
jgi:hypothetical protein